DKALAAGAVHVSAYVLTVESGTPLVQLIAQRKRAAVDDDAQASAYERIQQLLPARGLHQYEISSFARPGHESAHNRLYWGGAPYLGLGPSAHSMRHDAHGRTLRRQTTARFDSWVRDPIAAAHELEVLEPRHALVEAVAFGLRDLLGGIDLEALGQRHAVDARFLAPVLAASARAGDVELAGAVARLTPQGARFADRVARAVLAA
ncbi:MAG TPA: hypothetical protein VGO62_21225, partial [Myxococcota bacterium]